MSTIPTPIEETDTKPEPSKLSYELAYNVLKTIHRQELEILRWHMDRMHRPELATDERASSHAKEQVVEYYRATAATNGQLMPGWLYDRMDEHMQGFSQSLREYAFRTVEGDAAFEAAKKKLEEESPMNLVMELLRSYIEQAGETRRWRLRHGRN